VVLHKKNILISIITLGLFISLSIAVLTVPIRPFERFKAIYYELKEDNSPETLKSASIRYQVWSASWHSIKTNLYFGAGTGDVEKTLNKSYKKLNIKTATKRNLNTHNQFLQSWIALGLPGFLFLLSILLYPLITAYNRHDIYMAGIILSWGIFMLTESCLERQYGIILFTLLYLVLMKKTKHPI
jgi:O-antigen ligase